MDERFGVPGHSPQHAPDHSLHNPTPSTPGANIGGGWDAPAYNPPAAWGPTYGGSSSGGTAGNGGATYGLGGPVPRGKRSVILGAVLATILGPLGLFYVNVLSGIAGLVIIPPVVRSAAAMYALTHGGRIETAYRLAVPILWCITIPWAVIGVTIRNARIDRAAARRQAA